ncbi:MAG: DoxX family protein [Chthoniobacterales bacterium]
MNSAGTNASPIHFIQSAYGWLIKLASLLQSPLLLVVRLYWGWQFFITGKGKLEHLDKITQFFTSLGIPMPHFNAIMAGTTECVGGLLLLIGLASRLTCIPLTVVMIVAYVTADLDAVKAIFSDPDQFLGADPFQFLFAVLLVLAFGPGMFSVDALLKRRFGKPTTGGGN